MKNSTLKNKLALIAAFIFLSFSGRAQMLSTTETDELYNKAEALEKSANIVLTEFILKQEADKYDAAMLQFKEADSIYAVLLERGTEPESLAGIMGTLIEANRLIISTTGMLVSKEEILAETVADRKLKVKYNGETYKLTKTSKSYFEMLQPKN